MNPLSTALILALPYVIEFERMVAELKNNDKLCSTNQNKNSNETDPYNHPCYTLPCIICR